MLLNGIRTKESVNRRLKDLSMPLGILGLLTKVERVSHTFHSNWQVSDVTVDLRFVFCDARG